jgi:hypothetical protein
MTADALVGIVADAALRDGDLDEETKARLLQRRQEATDRIDPAFRARPGCAARRGRAPASGGGKHSTERASIDALISCEGGMLPLMQNEIRRMDSAAATRSTDTVGCALGAVAVVGVSWPTKYSGV